MPTPDSKPKPGSFLPYLEFEQRTARPGRVLMAPSPIALLEILGRQMQYALPISDLQTLSGMESPRYEQALRILTERDYISLEGDPIDRMVRLTKKGEDTAEVARAV